MCYPEFLIDYERTALLGWFLWTPTKICSENAWAHPSSLEKQLHFWWVTSIRFVFAKYISISIFPKMRGNLQPQNKDFNLLSFWFLFISRIFQIGLGDSQLCIHLTYGFQRQSWLVVDLPLWKIWVRQLGSWHSQLNGKSFKFPWFQSSNQNRIWLTLW